MKEFFKQFTVSGVRCLAEKGFDNESGDYWLRLVAQSQGYGRAECMLYYDKENHMDEAFDVAEMLIKKVILDGIEVGAIPKTEVHDE